MHFRSIFCLLIIVSFITACIKQSEDNSKNDLKSWKLKGKIKTLSEYNYSKPGIYTTNVLFNSGGFILEQSSFNPDRSLIRKWNYEYDNRDRKLNQKCYVLNDSLSYTINYYYNNHDSLVSTKVISGKDTISWLRSIVTYDVHHNKTQETQFGQKSNIEKQISYTYNKNNRVIAELHLDSVSHQRWRQCYKYNPQGLIEEITYTTLQGKLFDRMVFHYEKKKIREVCSYNSENKLVKNTIYSYNKEGDISKTSEYDPIKKSQNAHTYEYKYDKHGNWTSLIGRLNESVDILRTRKLEYFE